MRNIKGNLIRTAVIVPTVAIAFVSTMSPAFAHGNRVDKAIPRLEKMVMKRKVMNHERNIAQVVKRLEQLEYRISSQLKAKDKEGIERHLVINHDAERMIYEKIKTTDIQKELTDYALTKYKEREQNKIDENLDAYIKNINPDDTEPDA